MKKQKISKQEQEFWIEFDEKVKEEAEVLLAAWQAALDKFEEGRVATEKDCDRIHVSVGTDKIEEGKFYGCVPISGACYFGDGGRKNDLVEKLKNAPFIQEKEAKALTMLKRKYKLLKLAKVPLKVLGCLAPVAIAAAGVGAIVGGGFHAFAAAADLSTEMSFGIFGAYLLPGAGAIAGSVAYGKDMAISVSSHLDSKEGGIAGDIDDLTSWGGLPRKAVPIEKGISKKYLNRYGEKSWNLERLERARIITYEEYVEARIYMAMRDICRERALKEGSQEA